MKSTKLFAGVAALAIVIGLGFNAFATEPSVTPDTPAASVATPVEAPAAATAAADAVAPAVAEAVAPAAAPFAGDTLILDEALLAKVEGMKAEERPAFAATRTEELSKMPAADKEGLEKARSEWFSKLPADKQADFTARLGKVLADMAVKH